MTHKVTRVGLVPFFSLCFSHQVKFTIRDDKIFEMLQPHPVTKNFTSKASTHEVLNALENASA